ncbi:MAG: cell division protein ZapA [Candidatus Latescibacterota bacterium]|nr:MAG: cell division protein ZapA [Candidatus Latescibacterota bacterium]
MSEVSVTTVHIFGREYKIKGYADKSYIERIAKHVDEKMKEVAESTSMGSQERVAVLAALNIADELFQESKRNSDTFSSVEQRADQLITLLDRCLLTEK